MEKKPTLRDYRSLAEFRHQIRRFLRSSERAVRSRGLEPRQYQLLLALKGLPEKARPRIQELAEQLQIQHHSAVELADRLALGGLVRRERAPRDRREVLLRLTAKGEKVLEELALYHRAELSSRGPALIAALERVLEGHERISRGRRRAR